MCVIRHCYVYVLQETRKSLVELLVTYFSVVDRTDCTLDADGQLDFWLNVLLVFRFQVVQFDDFVFACVCGIRSAVTMFVSKIFKITQN